MRYIIILLSLLSCSSIQRNFQEKEMILSVDFQDNFEGDIVSFKTNDCEVFNNKKLYSHPNFGFTDISVKFIENEYELIMFIENNGKVVKKKKCTKLDDILISIKVNNNLNQYRVDISEGKYIGFTSRLGNRLYIEQSHYPFGYD